MAKSTGSKTAPVSIDTPSSIPKIDVQEMEVVVIGETGLVSHAWSKKAREEMLAKQMKKAKTAKVAKDPHRDFVESLYWLTPMPENPTLEDVAQARFGFPSIAFKNAMITAAGDVDGAKKTEMRRRIHVQGEFVEIDGTPVMRAGGDMVRIGMGTADIRFRGWFPTWRATVRISYNASAISPAQIVNLLNLAGFGVGIGEWRPERNGQFGRFSVATQADSPAV
jgi:hypothetical protein